MIKLSSDSAWIKQAAATGLTLLLQRTRLTFMIQCANNFKLKNRIILIVPKDSLKYKIENVS